MIPLHDIRRRNASIADALLAAMRRVLDSGDLILGPEVTTFEERFAAYCGVAHCVGVGNATEGFALAFTALGLRAGDEVVVAANAQVAPALAARRLGCKVVFVDPLDSTLLLGPESIAGKLCERTKAVVAVHLFGGMCDMEPLRALCDRQGAALVEDFSQAHGAALPQGRAGSFGKLSVCSFYPSKPLGALGDGGAILTNDGAIRAELAALRQYGWRIRDDTALPGGNSRLDEMQAAVLNVKLAYLDAWNQERAEEAGELRRALASLDSVELPSPVAGSVHHLFPVLAEDRDSVIRRLDAARIAWGIHYPTPIHRQELFRKENEGVTLPISEHACERILSVPVLDPDSVVEALS